MVIKYFGDDEAYKVAMNLEKDGIEFYSDLVKSAKDAILQEEKRHLVTLTKRLRRIK